MMSTSAEAEISAGSKSATSCAIGKLSVWSAARGSGAGRALLGLPTMRTRSKAIKPTAIPALAGRYRGTRKRGGGGETGGSDTEDHPEHRRDRVCLRAHPGKATAARPRLVVGRAAPPRQTGIEDNRFRPA